MRPSLSLPPLEWRIWGLTQGPAAMWARAPGAGEAAGGGRGPEVRRHCAVPASLPGAPSSSLGLRAPLMAPWSGRNGAGLLRSGETGVPLLHAQGSDSSKAEGQGCGGQAASREEPLWRCYTLAGTY